VRDACPSGLWARGVKLARDGKVTLESSGECEVVLRVAAGGRAAATSVVLYPGDRDWECDCDGRAAACEHVAAGALALSKAGDEQGELVATDPSPTGSITYRFERRPGQLQLTRYVATAGGEPFRLRRSLQAYIGGMVKGPPLAPERLDLEVDRVLGPGAPEVVLANLAPRLLAALAGCPRVTLDGEPVKVSADTLAPRARLSRRGAELVLRVAADPAIEAIVGPGVALRGGELHPLVATELAGTQLERLPMVRRFSGAEVAELVAEVLPAVRREIDVVIAADVELPAIDRSIEPRADLGLRWRPGGGLAVAPRIVYGRPPCAVVSGDRLIRLRGPVPQRDRAAEAELARRLRSELHLVFGRKLELPPGEAAELAERIRGSGLASPGEGDAASPLSARLIPTMNGGAGVEFVAAAGGRADAADVLGAWAAGAALVPLAGGGFGEVPADWLDEHGELVEALVRNLASPALGLGAAAELAVALDTTLPPRLEALRPLVADFDRLPAAELPGDLCGELRAYQRRGVDWLAFLRTAGLGAILADDMGLGKTLQALAALPRGRRSLVVGPTSVVPVWEREAARFRPGLPLCVYHGPGRRLDPEADLTITSYSLLRRDAEELTAIEWDAAILDEAQAIKNPDSQAARAAYRLKAGLRIAMSGTPVENRLDELWSLCHFTNPGLLGARVDFDREIGRPIAGGDGRALARLQTLIRPVLLRRTKAEVAPELPPRTEVVERCELDEREREIYDGVRAAARADVVKQLEGGGSPLAALAALMRLRQAACHPGLLPDVEADSSSKVDRLAELLDRAAAGGHKSLVFSQWTSLLDRIEPALAAIGLDWVRLDGSTRDRAAVVERFQSDESIGAMLISLKAGGTGLTLTAADHVFLVDPWWNPATEDQAADRAHRIGQTRPVLIHRLVAGDTVEERILALQERKRALAAAAVGGALGAGAGLTRDDLLALLQ
jgi:superfamily II DNA or RNA helicase